MAGTLTISTLSDGTNSTSSTNCIQGSAKAWVNFDGTGTPTVRASYNVSSITDNGTGRYTVNFTNAFADANYAVFGTTINTGQMGVQIEGAYNGSPTTYTTTAVYINTTQANNYYDCSIINVSVFR